MDNFHSQIVATVYFEHPRLTIRKWSAQPSEQQFHKRANIVDVHDKCADGKELGREVVPDGEQELAGIEVNVDVLNPAGQ